jgi:magnesium transporter
MIRLFTASSGILAPTNNRIDAPLPNNIAWIDLFNPSREEDIWVEANVGIEVPTMVDMQEIEDSARFYTLNDAHYMTAPMVHSAHKNNANLSPVTFILTKNCLITVRYCQPQAFSQFEAKAAKIKNGLLQTNAHNRQILLGLLESVTDRCADLLEGCALKLNHEQDALFSNNPNPMTTKGFRASMHLLGQQGAFLSKITESLAGFERMITYMHMIEVDKARLEQIDKDIKSLSRHNDLLSNKIFFLLDAVVGLVSVEQNGIIKIFSVAAVAFMPPTLVASIYGMNFNFMPELSWPFGYPFALGLMVLSALIPLLYFKFKKWL